MFLENLKLQNFRAYRNASVSIPRDGLVLVAGANNSGKSALLSALDVIAGSSQPAVVRHVAASEPARVQARFALSENERDQLLPSSVDQRIRESDALTWLEWHFAEFNESLVAFELHTSWPGHPDISLARIDSNGNLSVNDVIRALQGISDEGPKGWFEHGAVGFQSVESAFVGNIPVPAPIAQFLNGWRQHYYHFLPLRPGMTARTQSLSTPTKLVPSGENLPGVLLHLQTNRFAVWQHIRDLISQIVPDVGRLETPTNESNQMEVAFVDPYLPLVGGEPVHRQVKSQLVV